MTDPDRKFIFILKDHKQAAVHAKDDLEAINTFFEFFRNNEFIIL